MARTRLRHHGSGAAHRLDGLSGEAGPLTSGRPRDPRVVRRLAARPPPVVDHGYAVGESQPRPPNRLTTPLKTEPQQRASNASTRDWRTRRDPSDSRTSTKNGREPPASCATAPADETQHGPSKRRTTSTTASAQPREDSSPTPVRRPDAYPGSSRSTHGSTRRALGTTSR